MLTASTERSRVPSSRPPLRGLRDPASSFRDVWEKLEDAGDWLEKRPVPLVLILSLVYLAFVVPKAYLRPMWHDELFTYNLAISPSLSRMFHDIRLIDLNPPLLYILDYLILHLLRPANDHLASLAARIPSILAGLVGSLGVFAWLRHRLGPLWSLLSVSLLWATAFLQYAGEDRPYELMLAFAILLLLARERAVEPQRKLRWVGATILLGAAMVGSHFMGAFVLLAFLAAEAVRAWKRRRMDIPLILSYLLPFTIIAAFSGKVSGYGTILFPDAFRTHLITPLLTYVWVAWAAGPVLLTGLLLLFIPGNSRSGYSLQRLRALAAAAPLEYALLIGLFLEPLIAIAMIARNQGAFFPRYGLPASIPIAIVTAFVFCAVFNRSRGVAILATLALWWFPVQACLKVLGFPHTVHAASEEQARAFPDFRRIDPNLPFVDASALTYVEMNHYESPAFLQRTWYLTDHDGAVQYAHATLFEGEAEVARIFHFQSHVEPLQSFEAEHPKFLVLGTYDYPEQWLLRKLHADGELVRYLGSTDAGYRDHQLYEVTIRKRP